MGKYRECYNLAGEKVYELHKYCECDECEYRFRLKREPCNQITVTTKDISKVEDISEFLEGWKCKKGNTLLDREFIKF